MVASKVYIKYDAFISYSRRDEDWVRNWLLPKLEAGGARTCIDYRDFKPGALLVPEIERCVLQSRKTLLVLSPSYLESEWTKFENSLVQSLDPAALNRRVIPLLHIACDMPSRLKSIIYLDFTQPSSIDCQINRLLSVISTKKTKIEGPEHLGKKYSTILIVDDDKNWLNTLMCLTSDDGLTAESAESYSVAHQRILKSRDRLTAYNLAVCVIDLGLSGSSDMDGLGLLAHCKLLGIPTIAISNSRIEVMREDLQNRYGVIASFSKHPFPEKEFIETLNKVIQSQSKK